MHITYVTNNWAKLEFAKNQLEPFDIAIDNVKMDTPEIQADDVTEVAKYSAKWACEKLNKTVIKNDLGLFIKSLNGFPGAYTKFVEETIGEDGILKLMEETKDREAYFKEAIAYCEPGKEPVVFEGITKGRIAINKSGTFGWKLDFIFIPDGDDKTLGCFPDYKRWEFWNFEAYTKLADYLNNKRF